MNKSEDHAEQKKLEKKDTILDGSIYRKFWNVQKEESERKAVVCGVGEMNWEGAMGYCGSALYLGTDMGCSSECSVC